MPLSLYCSDMLFICILYLLFMFFLGQMYKFTTIKSCLKAHDPYWKSRQEWFDLLKLWEQNVPPACLLVLLEYLIENKSFKVVPNFLGLKWPVLLPLNIVWNISLHSFWNYFQNSFTFLPAKNDFFQMQTEFWKFLKEKYE